MPIRESQRKLYPPNWRDISQSARDRAQNRCEDCGVPNHAVGHRDQAGLFVPLAGSGPCDLAGVGHAWPGGEPLLYREAKGFADATNTETDGDINGNWWFVIVLTTAHLGLPAEVPVFLAVTGAAQTDEVVQIVGFGMALNPKGHEWFDMMHRRALANFFRSATTSPAGFVVTLPSGATCSDPGRSVAGLPSSMSPQTIGLTRWRYIREPFEPTDVTTELATLRDEVAAFPVRDSAYDASQFAQSTFGKTVEPPTARQRTSPKILVSLLGSNCESPATDQTILFGFAATGRPADTRTLHAKPDFAGMDLTTSFGARLTRLLGKELKRRPAINAVRGSWAQAWSGHEASLLHFADYPENCDPTNLKALCQKCHLNYDAQHHAQTAYQTRREGKAVADMFELPEELQWPRS